ncbi:MAG TPA: DUF2946 family protein [Luteimonas sp.]|nr:DUF2946 family protein [Luteimonas sp.]
MVRSRRRAFAWLALVAMLSLALLPTLGRLGAGVPVHAAMAMAGPMPAHVPGMAMDMAMHGHASTHHAEEAAHPQPVPGQHDGHDCTYCLLLSGLVGSAVLHWLPAASGAPTRVSSPVVSSRALDAPVPALGAQGPPSLELG